MLLQKLKLGLSAALVLIVAGAVFTVMNPRNTERVHVVVTFEPPSRLKEVRVQVIVDSSLQDDAKTKVSPYSEFFLTGKNSTVVVFAHQGTAGEVTCTVTGKLGSVTDTAHTVDEAAVCRYPGS